MRRTSLVLAVVVAMVTVLVFAAPAFAVSLPSDAQPSGPQPPDGTQVTPDPKAPNNTIGDLASGEAIDATRHEGEVLGPEAPGYHIIRSLPLLSLAAGESLESPGDLVQYCQDNPGKLIC